MDLVVRDVALWEHGAAGRTVDVAVAGDVIAAVGPDLPIGELPPDRIVDADGRIGVAGLVDTHLHLDKSRLLHALAEHGSDARDGLTDAIERTRAAKAAFTVDDVHERAAATLRECVARGTTHVRTHVEVDPVVGTRGLDGVLAAARDLARAVDVDVCVFAQEGLTDAAATDALLVGALEAGACVVGGAPYTDVDPDGQLDRVFALARAFDVDVDLHLDLAETLDGMQLHAVCDRTVAAGWEGRVTVGHVTRLALLHPDGLAETARRVADAGVAVTVLPSTDLFLMGRGDPRAKVRGVAPLAPLRAAGVTCSLATNNVLNPFTPFGEGSLLRQANLYANVAHVGDGAGLRDCLRMVTDDAARIVGRAPTRFAPGAPADLVLLDATDPALAVAAPADAIWGMRAGQPTFSHPPAVLHAPTRAAR